MSMTDVTPNTAPPTAMPSTAPPAPAAPAAARPGSIPREQYDALPEDRKAAYAHVSRPGGGTDYVERSTLPSESGADAATGGDASTTAPALVPGEKYKFGDLELTGQEILDLLKHKGETDMRRAAVPADPSQYRLPDRLPSDALPPGFDFKFDANDPELAAAKNWAHANELSQAQFDDLMTNYAAMEARKQAVYADAQKAELAKLGDRATMRVTAIDTFFTGLLGAEDAKHIRSSMYSAGVVKALEKMASKFQNQNAASFSQAHREPPNPNTGPLSSMSEEHYDSLSAAEKFRISRLG
jgi:hypothetical protein